MWSFLNPKLRTARRVLKSRIKEAKKLMRRAKGQITPSAHADVADFLSQAQATINGEDVAAMHKAAERLLGLVNKHLSKFRKAAWRESLESIAIAVLVALFLRSFVLEAFKIPSGSMIPTLAIGDQIFVNKLLYGIRIPWTTHRLLNFALPKRGEVIVFVCPVGPQEDYIKRLIGLPGDEISVRAGVISINGQPLSREFVHKTEFWDREARSERWYPFEALVYKEKIGDTSHVVIFDADQTQSAPDFGPYVVPEGHVFMMGDNRDHSFDSRAWGPVPAQNILGRSLFVWFSLGRSGLAWERLGTWIE